jgi:uncharacterized tellurite resistance protein B-like protein
MPVAMKRWFDSLDTDKTFLPKNPEAFKRATASIVCSIVNFNDVESKDALCKFCNLFKEEFHIDEETAEKLFEDAGYVKKNLEKNAEIIKDELENDEYKLMEYMKMLNRFIIVDNCKEEDYCIFDELKTKLFQ